MINTNLSEAYLHNSTVFRFFLDAEKMLFTAMMTHPEISPFEDIITVRYDTLLAVRRLFAVAIKYSPVTPTHLSHISSFNRLSINIGSGTNRNNEHSQLKKTCTAKSCWRARQQSFPRTAYQSPEATSPWGYQGIPRQCDSSSLLMQNSCLLNSNNVPYCPLDGQANLLPFDN